ncbi:lipopolysaccharide-induced tumor necrosis factor-alpha factor homolog [Pseudoliparis swirei]|uniref:lipopolysaccharide-induced tumor necrosis factor-alpha factor homolog n=1 Tax=Pseudoliparis swirei TaxID=2059687 RepID=UPI0024BEA4A0|nr:lipopolysaccharide-induced tumor necrosis factor-alpha factor homolog [Pseudoliparis swirei]
MEPPSYEEASLHPPVLDTAVFSILPPPSYSASLHSSLTPPPTYGEAVGRTPAAVTTQPAPVPISVTHLGAVPGLVRCPHCHHLVISKVTYEAGKAAWCTCMLLAMMGLICGCCLIPFMVRGLQDAHHSCPHCKNHLHVSTT